MRQLRASYSQYTPLAAALPSANAGGADAAAATAYTQANASAPWPPAPWPAPPARPFARGARVLRDQARMSRHEAGMMDAAEASSGASVCRCHSA